MSKKSKTSNTSVWVNELPKANNKRLSTAPLFSDEEYKPLETSGKFEMDVKGFIPIFEIKPYINDIKYILIAILVVQVLIVILFAFIIDILHRLS